MSAECSTEGCSKPVHSKGLCQAHYRQMKRRERGLQKPGPKPDPTRPGSRHNRTSSTRSYAERPADSVQTPARKFATETHCANDHEFTPENTYVYPEGHQQAGEKVCKICRRNAQRKYKGLPALPDDTPVGLRNKDKTHCPAQHSYAEHGGFNNDGSRYCKRCVKDRRIQSTYGISLETLEQMLVDQDNRCWICTTVFDREEDAHLDHCHTSGTVRGLLCANCNRGIGMFHDNPKFLARAIQYLNHFGYEVIPSSP